MDYGFLLFVLLITICYVKQLCQPKNVRLKNPLAFRKSALFLSVCCCVNSTTPLRYVKQGPLSNTTCTQSLRIQYNSHTAVMLSNGTVDRIQYCGLCINIQNRTSLNTFKIWKATGVVQYSDYPVKHCLRRHLKGSDK